MILMRVPGLALVLAMTLRFQVLAAARPPASDLTLFAPTNLVAWCIVPFDSKKRGPEERAAMLEQLGFKLFAYDYRAEHVPTFDAEMDALQRHHIKLLAWWFPGELNADAKLILDVLNRHHLRKDESDDRTRDRNGKLLVQVTNGCESWGRENSPNKNSICFNQSAH